MTVGWLLTARPALRATHALLRPKEFFSIEGFVDFFKQLLAFYATPSLETPAYTILRRARAAACHVMSCHVRLGPVRAAGACMRPVQVRATQEGAPPPRPP